MKQWVLQSPRLNRYFSVAHWMQEIYDTELAFDGRIYLVDRIDQFEVLSVDRGDYVVVALVQLDEVSRQSPTVQYNAELNIEVDPNARRN